MKIKSVKLLLILLVSVCSFNLKTQASLRVLMEDMKTYRTVNTRFHAGHVFEHSVWVARSVINMLKGEWATKIENPKVLIVAALLHDIGKCGDGIHEFDMKPEHPDKGFNYIMGMGSPYIMADGRRFDFSDMFSELSLGAEDISLIAIIAGMHHELGALMRGLNALDVQCFDRAVAKLSNLIRLSGYNGGVVDIKSKKYRKLIKYICLVSVADVISSQVVPYSIEHLFINQVSGLSLSDVANTHADGLGNGMDGFRFFKYDTVGLSARTAWLSLCK